MEEIFFLTTKGGINSWTLICLLNVMRLRTESFKLWN